MPPRNTKLSGSTPPSLSLLPFATPNPFLSSFPFPTGTFYLLFFTFLSLLSLSFFSFYLYPYFTIFLLCFFIRLLFLCFSLQLQSFPFFSHYFLIFFSGNNNFIFLLFSSNVSLLCFLQPPSPIFYFLLFLSPSDFLFSIHIIISPSPPKLYFRILLDQHYLFLSSPPPTHPLYLFSSSTHTLVSQFRVHPHSVSHFFTSLAIFFFSSVIFHNFFSLSYVLYIFRLVFLPCPLSSVFSMSSLILSSVRSYSI